MTAMYNFWLKGLIGPQGWKASGAETTARFGAQGDLIASALRGKYAEACGRGLVFGFGVTGVTVPANANNLVSVCGIYNPPDSGVDVEIIDTEITQVLAATVVNSHAWFADATAALSAAATFTTAGAAYSKKIGSSPANKARVYSAVTHSGTPVKRAVIGQDGATTNLQGIGRRKEYDGSLIIPPGFLASVASSTAANTASGLAVDFSWLEVPIQ